jgi:hypothetical protein
MISEEESATINIVEIGSTECNLLRPTDSANSLKSYGFASGFPRNLVLIDKRILDIDHIISSLDPTTEYILFDFHVDTIADIQERITKHYESIAIIQHNYNLPTYQLVANCAPSTLTDLGTADPALETWREYIAFLVWLKTDRGVHYVDLLACDLWANENWKYLIETIRTREGIHLRASVDITGEGGDFILESDGVDMVGVYFTEGILEYKYAFADNSYFYSVSRIVNINTGPAISTATVASTIFNTPGEIAFDSLNNLYVADTNNHVIRVIPKQNGTLYGVPVIVGNTYIVAGTENTAGTNVTNGVSNLSCTLNFPYSIAFDSSNNMFISDSNNHTVRVIPKTNATIYNVNCLENNIYRVVGTGIAGTGYDTNTSTRYDGVNIITTNRTQQSTSSQEFAVTDDNLRMITTTYINQYECAYQTRNNPTSAWSNISVINFDARTTNMHLPIFISITPSGSRLVVVSVLDSYFSDWNGTSYNPLIKITGIGSDSSRKFNSITISEDGGRIALARSENDNFRVVIATWNGTNYNAIQTFDPLDTVSALHMTRDGTRLFFDIEMYTWDNITNTYINRRTVLDGVVSSGRQNRRLSSSPDGNIIFCSNNTSGYPTNNPRRWGKWNTTTSVYDYGGEFSDIPPNELDRYYGMWATLNYVYYRRDTIMYQNPFTYNTTIVSTPIRTSTSVKLRNPKGISFDVSNNLYIADTGNHVIKVISKSSALLYGIATLQDRVYTLAGTEGSTGSSVDNVPIINATLLNNPYDIAIDSSRNLYISDTANNVIRAISNNTGSIFTKAVVPNRMYIVAGNSNNTNTNGVGENISPVNALVKLYFPRGIALDGSNSLYISDAGSVAIRVVSNKTGIIGETSVIKNNIYTMVGLLNTTGVASTVKTDMQLNNSYHIAYNNSDKNVYYLNIPPDGFTYDYTPIALYSPTGVFDLSYNDQYYQIFFPGITYTLKDQNNTTMQTATVDASANTILFSGASSRSLQYGPNTLRIYAGATAIGNPITINTVCFREGTRILCFDKRTSKPKYIPIEKLKPGTLVKTLTAGFVPIKLIGHSILSNSTTETRIRDSLYKCSRAQYPELIGDLYITGNHSILVHELSEKQRAELGENVYTTEGEYRLPAWLDMRAERFRESGEFRIWHFALEHHDYYMNYGVYANGLLVESTSLRFMNELAGMVFVSPDFTTASPPQIFEDIPKRI